MNTQPSPLPFDQGKIVTLDARLSQLASVPLASSFRLSVLVPVYNERHLVEASLRRLLAVKSDLISAMEVIVVDDCSTDGSWDALTRLAAQDERISLFRHHRNCGKGAAIRTALEYATGEISIVHDADLEYHPEDIPALLVPFAKDGADAVFGSRYLPGMYRRALTHRHTMINKGITFIANCISDLSLTDLETGYKAVKTTLLKSIPLRSDDFRFEVEIAFKLAKRGARIFEVPIRYLPRNEREGKKIRPRDGVLALAAILRFSLIDDIYQHDQYGSNILVELESARRFSLWMGDVLRPYVGDRVLEVGAGIGNLSSQFLPRDFYVASDVNPHYLEYLSAFAQGKPYLHVLRIDAGSSDDFVGLEEQFDTVVMINVLEHVPDPAVALANVRSALQPGGRAVILVPAHPRLFGTLDEVLEHRERYTPEKLRGQLVQAGLRVEQIFDFNRISVPGWWFNGRVLQRKKFSKIQLKALNTALPVLKHLDRLIPWSGLSVIATAVKD
ncbi:MAG: glycosyltransferase [Candidatus Sulfotelmatobacter sp.]